MSNKLSFLGETPSIALRNALNECGEEAIVISTKKISDKIKDGKDMYEVLVTIDDEEEMPPSPLGINNSNNKVNIDFINDFRNEIAKMQNAIEQVQKSMWQPKSQLYDLTIPPEFIDIYNTFEKNEFDQEMTYTIMKKTIQNLPVSHKKNSKKINDFFKLVLRRIIPVKHEILLSKQQRKIVMLVGPTGVGKTTTIAKLAARYAYKLAQNYKVGIITLDSFRVGAIEQLQAYTNIMRLPLEIVKKPEDLIESLIRLKDCNYIFIDTAGSSQYDLNKIEAINEYQLKINDLPMEKNLVMPANVKQSDLQEIYENYSRLDINNLIFTKLDETKSFGNLISFAHKTKKSITYLSIGQNVPDDLVVSDPNYLINSFMKNGDQ